MLPPNFFCAAPVRQLRAAGIAVGLGTDGPSSGNTLSMFDQMRLFAVSHKTANHDRSLFPAREIVALATRGGAQAFGLDAGEIRVGAAADFLILDPDAVPLVPGFNRTSDLVYAADPSCLDTVVCAGRVLMEGGVVPCEEEIVAAARLAARLLV